LASADRGFAYYVYRTCFALGRYTPRPVAAGLGWVAGRYCAATMADRRVLVGRNLERVAGRALSEAEKRRGVMAAFDSYARYWMESTRATGATAAELEARMSLEGLGHIQAALAAGRGAIIALPHLGSWDFGGAWIASTGYPLTVVAEEVKPRALFDWFVEMRAEMGLEVIPLGPTAAGAVGTALRANKLVALVSDRDLVGNGVEVEFFGERTRLPAGPATMALRTGAAILPAAIYLRPKGRCHAVICPALPVARSGGGLRQDVAQVTQNLARELEKLIRQAPEQWHMFQPNWPSDPGYGS
jgi:lauroyl/myristoyl acyltransferase